MLLLIHKLTGGAAKASVPQATQHHNTSPMTLLIINVGAGCPGRMAQEPGDQMAGRSQLAQCQGG